MTFTVIYEKGPTSWGAYVPALSSCLGFLRTPKLSATTRRHASGPAPRCLRVRSVPVMGCSATIAPYCPLPSK
jgi:hypothetical protein